MKTLLLLSLLGVGVASCSNPNVYSLTIENSSDHVVDSAKITIAGAVLKFGLINVNASQTVNFSIGQKSKAEGVFFGSIFMHSSDIIHTQFGYYSNTSDIQKTTKIRIEKTNKVKTIGS